jgi:multidrug efflux pump subunit AcrA (membrane-fusion protein)
VKRLAFDGRSILWSPLLVAAIAALNACARSEGEGPQPTAVEPTPVQTVHLMEGPITRTITLPAQVIPLQQATLYAKVSGYLKSIHVDKGDKVKAGAVLARIEIPELVAARAKQAAELTAAESDYKRLAESLQKTPDLVVPNTVDQRTGERYATRLCDDHGAVCRCHHAALC